MNSDLLNLKENKNHGDFNILLSTYKGEITDSFPHVVLHWHKEIEMTLILRGKAEYKIDFTTYQVKEGDIITIKGRTRNYTGGTISSNDELTYLTVEVV